MSLTACVLCHHEELRPRWVGDLLMTYCEQCGCLYTPESGPAIRVESPLGPDRSTGPAVPATVSPLLLAVT